MSLNNFVGNTVEEMQVVDKTDIDDKEAERRENALVKIFNKIISVRPVHKRSKKSQDKVDSKLIPMETQDQAFERFVETLLHSAECNEFLCMYKKSCPEMKRLHSHGKLCKRKQAGKCAICKTVEAYCSEHFNKCQGNESCPMGFCALYMKANEKSSQENQCEPWDEVERRLTALKTSSSIQSNPRIRKLNESDEKTKALCDRVAALKKFRISHKNKHSCDRFKRKLQDTERLMYQCGQLENQLNFLRNTLIMGHSKTNASTENTLLSPVDNEVMQAVYGSHSKYCTKDECHVPFCNRAKILLKDGQIEKLQEQLRATLIAAKKCFDKSNKMVTRVLAHTKTCTDKLQGHCSICRELISKGLMRAQYRNNLEDCSKGSLEAEEHQKKPLLCLEPEPRLKKRWEALVKLSAKLSRKIEEASKLLFNK